MPKMRVNNVACADRARRPTTARMSASGPEQTSLVAPHVSAFGGKADIPKADISEPKDGISNLTQINAEHRGTRVKKYA